jgi:hypothetical protein
MNYLVFLDAQAGELEKILSGLKSMVAKEFDPARPAGRPIRPGDGLYFLRNQAECALRVKATVVRVLSLANYADEERCQILKEMQPRLQLTEDQYNTWVTKKQVLLVEFASAQKMGVVHLAADRIADRSEWIPFEEFGVITEQKVADEHPTFLRQTQEQ